MLFLLDNKKRNRSDSKAQTVCKLLHESHLGGSVEFREYLSSLVYFVRNSLNCFMSH